MKLTNVVWLTKYVVGAKANPPKNPKRPPKNGKIIPTNIVNAEIKENDDISIVTSHKPNER